MIEPRERLYWLPGFSPDTYEAPQLYRYLPTRTPVDEKHRCVIFQYPEGENGPNRPSKFPAAEITKIGDIITFEHPFEDDGMYSFINRGFELWTHPESGEYSYMIYPEVEINENVIRNLDQMAQLGVLEGLVDIYPITRVRKNAGDEEEVDDVYDGYEDDETADFLGILDEPAFSISVDIRMGNLNMLRATAVEIEKVFGENISCLVEDKDNRLDIWGAGTHIIQATGSNGMRYFQPTMTARIPKITEEVIEVFDCFADYRTANLEQSTEALKDILFMTHSTVTLEEVYPFRKNNVWKTRGNRNR